jgi:thiamine kinase
MNLRDVAVLCETIVPGDGPVQIDELSVSLVNRSYRVARGGRAYVLRVPAADGALIALDRDWEAGVLSTAAHAGLASELRYHDPALGILLSDWLSGRTWAGVDLAGAEVIERAAQLLRRVHALPVGPAAHRMTPAAWIAHYESLQAKAPGRRAAARTHLNEWDSLPSVAGVLCHGDLHALNLIEDSGSLKLLDWEYAHVTEPFWDLAGWCANADFDATTRHLLLESYLGAAPSAGQRRRLDLLMWLYDYVCWLWSALYLNRVPGSAQRPAIAARAALLDARLSIPAN